MDRRSDTNKWLIDWFDVGTGFGTGYPFAGTELPGFDFSK